MSGDNDDAFSRHMREVSEQRDQLTAVAEKQPIIAAMIAIGQLHTMFHYMVRAACEHRVSMGETIDGFDYTTWYVHAGMIKLAYEITKQGNRITGQVLKLTDARWLDFFDHDTYLFDRGEVMAKTTEYYCSSDTDWRLIKKRRELASVEDLVRTYREDMERINEDLVDCEATMARLRAEIDKLGGGAK